MGIGKVLEQWRSERNEGRISDFCKLILVS